MGIATVRGRFGTFEGTIDASGDAPVLEGTVDVATIDTGDANRDGHLKGPEFFDADQQPHDQLPLHRHRGRRAAATITLQGEITIKGITKPIELTGEIAENGQDPWGNERIGLELDERDRPPRVRPQVEPDPPQRQPSRRQRGQAAGERVRGQERLVR